jgi:hypothetical protein
MNDHAANSAVAHEKIRSAPDDEQRQIFAPAKANQFREGRLGARLDPKLRRDRQRAASCVSQRFVKPDVALFADDRLQFFRDHEIGGEISSCS